MDENIKLEMVKTEYSLYETAEIASREDVFKKIYAEIAEAKGRREKLMEEDKDASVKLDLLKGYGDKVGEQVGIPDNSIVLDDMSYLSEQVRIVECYLTQLDSVFGVLNEENYQEVNKLVSFARYKYFKNYESVEELRGSAVDEAEEDTDQSAFSLENSQEVSAFIEEQLKELGENTNLRKTSGHAKSKATDKLRGIRFSKKNNN